MCLNCSVIGWYARLGVVHSLPLSVFRSVPSLLFLSLSFSFYPSSFLIPVTLSPYPLAPCTTSDAPIDGFRNIGTEFALSRYSCRCGRSLILADRREIKFQLTAKSCPSPSPHSLSVNQLTVNVDGIHMFSEKDWQKSRAREIFDRNYLL